MPERRILFGEFLPDGAEVGADGIQGVRVCNNVVPSANGYQSIRGWDQWSTSTVIPSPTAITGGISTKNNTATEDFFGDDNDIFHCDSGKAITRVSKTDGIYTAPVGTEFWDFAQYGQKVIAVHGAGSSNDATQVFNHDTSTDFADLGGSPPKAKTVTTLRDFVVMGNTWDSTDGTRVTRVRWSGFGDETAWTPSAASQADFQDLKSDVGEVQAIRGGEDAFVVCRRGVYFMTYVGPPTIMRFDLILPGIGTDHPQSVVRFGPHVYFYSDAGFARVGIDGSIAYIGDGKVDKSAFLDLNAEASGTRFRGYLDQRNHGIGWQWDATTGASYFYSYRYDRWTEMGSDRANCSFMWSSDLSDYGATSGAREATAHGIGTNGSLYGATGSDAAVASVGTGYIQLSPHRWSLLERIYPLMEGVGEDMSDPVLKVSTLNEVQGLNVDHDVNLAFTSLTWDTTDGSFTSDMDQARYHKLMLELSANAAGRAVETSFYGLDVTYRTMGRF